MAGPYNEVVAQYRAPVYLTLLVGGAALFSVATLRKPVATTSAGSERTWMTRPTGETLASGIARTGLLYGLPRSFVLEPLQVSSGTGVDLVDTGSHQWFAELIWDEPNGVPLTNVYRIPARESAWFQEETLAQAAMQRFFSEDRTRSKLDLGARIDWYVNGYEIRFELYPDPRFDPRTAIGMSFDISPKGNCVFGKWLVRSSDGWQEMDDRKIRFSPGEGWQTWSSSGVQMNQRAISPEEMKQFLNQDAG